MEIRRGIILLILIFNIPLASALKEGWTCDHHYMCENGAETHCMGDLDQNIQYLLVCRDLNGDGCYEPDYDNPVYCPTNRCEQISKQIGQCISDIPTCPVICYVGETNCLTDDVEYYCYEDSDGCWKWDARDCESGFTCPPMPSGLGYDPYPSDRGCIRDDGCDRCEHSRCMINEYEACGDWNNDDCDGYYTIETGGDFDYNMFYYKCEFGCNGNGRECNLKPQEPDHSICSLGDTRCIEDSECYSSCVFNPATNKNYYGTESVDVTCCSQGTCRDIGDGDARCFERQDLFPTYNKTHFDVLMNGKNVTSVHYLGMGQIGETFYRGEIVDSGVGGDNYSISVYDEDWKYVKGYNHTPCANELTEGGNMYSMTTDGVYIYILDYYTDGTETFYVIEKYTEDAKCIEVVVNTTMKLAFPIAVSDNFIFTGSYTYGGYGSLIHVFQKNSDGSLNAGYLNSYKPIDDLPNKWSQIVGMSAYGGYVWLTPAVSSDESSMIYKYTTEIEKTGVEFNTTKAGLLDNLGGGIDPYGIIVSDGKIWFTEADRHIYELDYFGSFRSFDECNKGDLKCSGLYYVDGDDDGTKEWIRPYLRSCNDFNTDGYNTWSLVLAYLNFPDATTECQYGCHFNETEQEAECRNLPKPDCTQADWDAVPNSTRCKFGFIQRYEELYDDNCYYWVKERRCDKGCLADGTDCNICYDICKSGDSGCFPSGFGRGDRFFEFPMVIECGLNNNNGCYEWDITTAERCPLGCHKNSTGSFCWTEDELDDYGGFYLLNMTGTFKELQWIAKSLLDQSFPQEDKTVRYSVAIIIGLILTTIVVVGSKTNIRLGILFLSVYVLICSLFGWLPEYITFLAIVIGAIFLAKKFTSGGKDG